MTARKSSRVDRKYKTQYRVRNWPEYERGLRKRGDVLIWFNDEAIEAWTPPRNGCRGGQPRYSNLAVLTALTLRAVFQLPFRQTEGFLNSLLRLMALELAAPDHTTLSRRSRGVEIPPLKRSGTDSLHLIVDSTGLKILGAGEWNTSRHKSPKARRGWRKLHIGVDEEGFIVAAKLTRSSDHDATIFTDLVEQIDAPVRRFTADGTYDTRSVYEKIGDVGTKDLTIVIPPRRDAVTSGSIEGPWAQRDAVLDRIRAVGRQAWQKESGYRLQARVENAFFRYKRTLGGRLRSRDGEKQAKEAMIGCMILNRMKELGTPDSYPVLAPG